MRIRLSPNPLRSAYALWFMGWTVFFFLLFHPFMWLFLQWKSTWPLAQRLRQLWFSSSMLFGLVRIKVIYEAPLDPELNYVIVSNHTSWLDGLILTVKMPSLTNFVVMEELRKIPLFGVWFRTYDISVDRKNPRSGAIAYRKAQAWLKQKRNTVIFPEGVVTSKVPQLSAFKNGPFRLAIEQQVHLLPVTFIHTWEILPDRGLLEGKPGRVIMVVHAAEPTSGMKLSDTNALKEKVFQIIHAKLRSYGYQ